MPADQRNDYEEWRLGIEPGERHDPAAVHAPAASRPDPENERLERPVMMITVERLYWAILALYALASRMLMLGARPLGPVEARRALAAYQTMHLGVAPAPPAAWIQLLDAALLGAFGAGDFSARLLFALCGVGLVLIALAFRPFIGRSGALAMATMVALSPSLTYFSRSGVTQAPALLAALTVVVLFATIARAPSAGRAVGLGCAAGLALSADAQNLVVGAGFALALAILGIWRLAGTDELRLRLAIWWRRYSRLLSLAVVVAVLSWGVAGNGFFSRGFFSALLTAIRANWSGAAAPGSALAACLASLLCYEFLVAAAALVGVFAVLTNFAGSRSPLAIFALIWTIMAAAFFALTPAFSPPWIVEILVPAILLGAIGIEALARTRAWNLLFYPLAALGIATFYVQMATNFVIVAPAPTEAPWARHALLFWSQPVTAAGATEALARAVTAGGAPATSVWIAADSPVLEWYLRDLRSVHNPADADLIAGATEAPSGWPIAARSSFDLESWWRPGLGSLRARQAILFLLLEHAWQPLESRSVTVLTRATIPPTPITIYAPPASMPAASAAPSPRGSPTATPSITSTAAPQPTD
ncbi:MAG TPA: hypothetical protein VMV15_03455 [Candidatus Binataceae bacterium]|nr:hypothetical protein [Candidatus Binataceae bacterium]